LRKNGSWAKWRQGWRTTLNMILFDYSSIIITLENIFGHQNGFWGALVGKKNHASRQKLEIRQKSIFLIQLFFLIRSKQIYICYHWYKNALAPLCSLLQLIFLNFLHFFTKNKNFPNFGALQRRPWSTYPPEFFFIMLAIHSA